MKFIRTAFAGTVICAAALGSVANTADKITVGILLSLTDPATHLTSDIASAAELAFKEASDSGQLLNGATIVVEHADSTCTDIAAAVAAGERLIAIAGVAAIVGTDCSASTKAVANNVAIPNSVVMISPSATAHSLTTIDDNGFLFRTAPSAAHQGQVLAEALITRDIDEVAITYLNEEDKAIAEFFASAFIALHGKVILSAAYDDERRDYSTEFETLSDSAKPTLIVFGYHDQSGSSIVQTELGNGVFKRFIVAGAKIRNSLPESIDDDQTGTLSILSDVESDDAATLTRLLNKASTQGTPFTGEAYDAGALIVLAIQRSGTADRKSIQANIMSVANPPGVKIYPGELAKALEILASGGDVDYEGASAITLDVVGDATGTYQVLEFKDGKFNKIR